MRLWRVLLVSICLAVGSGLVMWLWPSWTPVTSRFEDWCERSFFAMSGAVAMAIASRKDKMHRESDGGNTV